jgi:hypothetical protein
VVIIRWQLLYRAASCSAMLHESAPTDRRAIAIGVLRMGVWP